MPWLGLHRVPWIQLPDALHTCPVTHTGQDAPVVMWHWVLFSSDWNGARGRGVGFSVQSVPRGLRCPWPQPVERKCVQGLFPKREALQPGPLWVWEGFVFPNVNPASTFQMVPLGSLEIANAKK